MPIKGDEVWEDMEKYLRQPKIDQVGAAYAHAIDEQRNLDNFKDALDNLRNLRNKKTTWVGEYENEMRRDIDDFLEFYS